MMQLGDHISFEKDGTLYTERIESVHYNSGSPAIWRRPSWWQRVILRRKPTLVRPAEPPQITINDSDQNPAGKTLAQLEQIKAGLDSLM